MLKKISAFFIFSFVVLCPLLKAQNCQPPVITANVKSDNLFSDEQEMVLGEMVLQQMSGEVRLVKNEQLQAYINEIGQRLIKHLPPTGLKFQFHLIDISDANAYNIPGGHILVSRKLISFVNNEDELAGVIAHELGHATVHHGAADISKGLRKILKISALGDRQDVEEKFNLLIENSRTKSVSQKIGHEDNQQMEADKIGLYAMIAAGYDSNAFYTFFDRLTESEGKTGGWFSDLFDKTTPAQKRLREMAAIFGEIPKSCRDGQKADATEDFLKWQAEVVSFRNTERKEELPGLLWKQDLTSKLRSDISRIVVSRDGKYFVARDDFSLTVVERAPLRVLFQIPVEGADDVYITPDNQSVVFVTDNLRFERWNIAEKKPSEIRELVLRRDCIENRLSPDGNYLACVDAAINLKILDTRTGKSIYQKKEFYRLNYIEYMSWYYADAEKARQRNFFRIEFSPDTRTVIFSRSNFFRSDDRTFSRGFTGVTQKTALALDLTTLKPIEMDGSFKSITSREYAFLDSQRILGMPSEDPNDAGIFSFPDGKRLQKIPFYAREIRTTGNPDFVIVKPLENSTMGAFDVKNNVIVAGMNKEDAAVWNNLFIYESISGKIIIRELKGEGKEKTLAEKDLATIEIPVAAVSRLNAVQVSNNFNWIIMSSRTRGGLWDTATGERKVFARGFRGGVIADDGSAVGEFPKYAEAEHTLALLSPKTKQVSVIQNLPEKGAKQYGRFVLTRSSLKEKDSAPKDEKKTTPTVPDFDDGDAKLRSNVRFELRNFVENKVIWSRDFLQYAPFYSFDEYSGRLIFYWYLGSEAGKAALKEHPELKSKAEALKTPERDYLIEVVDAFAGKTIGSMIVETGNGSFRVRTGSSESDWLLLYDSTDRVLTYSIKTGELRRRFFGNHAAINPERNQIAVENFPGEISIYNLETGERQANFVINGDAGFVRFNPEGNKLFILTAAQSAYAFDLNKIAKPAPKL